MRQAIWRWFPATMIAFLGLWFVACGGDNKAPAADAGTIKTNSGLQYVVLNQGSGAVAQPGKFVSVHCTGWLTDGKKFYSTKDTNQPYEFVLGTGSVIKGWDEGINGMKVGDRRKLVIPPDLGYGAAGFGGGVIPGGATLIFEVELMAVK